MKHHPLHANGDSNAVGEQDGTGFKTLISSSLGGNLLQRNRGGP
jgi:hypothetical protein